MECGTLSESGAPDLSQQHSTSEGKQFEDMLDLDLVGAAVAELFDGSDVSLRATRLLLEQWVGNNLESQKGLIRRLAVQAMERAFEVPRPSCPTDTAKELTGVWEPLPLVCDHGPGGESY